MIIIINCLKSNLFWCCCCCNPLFSAFIRHLMVVALCIGGAEGPKVCSMMWGALPPAVEPEEECIMRSLGLKNNYGGVKI
jgi:hypothetical protein